MHRRESKPRSGERFITTPVLLMIPVVLLLIAISLAQVFRSQQETLDHVRSGMRVVSTQISGDLHAVDQYMLQWASEDEHFIRLSEGDTFDLNNRKTLNAFIATIRYLNTVSAIFPNVPAVFVRFPCTGRYFMRGSDVGNVYSVVQGLQEETLFRKTAIVKAAPESTELIRLHRAKGTNYGFEFSTKTYCIELKQDYPLISNVIIYPVGNEPGEETGNGISKGIVLTEPLESGQLMIQAVIRRRDLVRAMPFGVFLLLMVSVASIAVVPIITRYYYQRIYKMQLTIQQTQMDYYSQQIRPHFILNALNRVYTHEAGEWPLVKEEILALTKYFRYVVNVRQDFVSLSGEMQFTKNYLDIQKMLRGDHFYAMVQWDPALNNAKIPPLVLSSIVENSIKHALKNDERCVIAVIAKPSDEDSMTIRISDSGDGFPDEVLTQIAHFIETDEVGDQLGVGIVNTIRRLWIAYKGHCQIQFSNENGAVVTLVLPAGGKSDETSAVSG